MCLTLAFYFPTFVNESMNYSIDLNYGNFYDIKYFDFKRVKYVYPFIEKVMINKTIEKFLKPEKNTSI